MTTQERADAILRRLRETGVRFTPMAAIEAQQAIQDALEATQREARAESLQIVKARRDWQEER